VDLVRKDRNLFVRVGCNGAAFGNNGFVNKTRHPIEKEGRPRASIHDPVGGMFKAENRRRVKV
ncbi:MAG: hypothetical protein RSC40_08985, partial [Clostridia bacterium]